MHSTQDNDIVTIAFLNSNVLKRKRVLDYLVNRSFKILCQKVSVSRRKAWRWEQPECFSPASSAAKSFMAPIASQTLLVIKHCWTAALQQEKIYCCLLLPQVHLETEYLQF